MTSDPSEPSGDEIYKALIDKVRQRGLEKLGLMTSWAWYDDPKRLAFTLARYKFVSKMIAGSQSALEIGCGDGFGSRVVRQAVDALTAVDFDPEFIATAVETSSEKWPVTFKVHDLFAGGVEGDYDAIYSLDVLEHIEPEREDEFITNMIAPLRSDGVCIIGMPSLQSQAHASALSKLGHINCKDQPTTRDLMKRYFSNVFMFSMNDEVVHTGYHEMSHYNIALCCGKRS